jgi:hypothetical protein
MFDLTGQRVGELTRAWRWIPGESGGDVVVTTTRRRWANLLFNLQAGRNSAANGFMITGEPDRAREFKALALIR